MVEAIHDCLEVLDIWVEESEYRKVGEEILARRREYSLVVISFFFFFVGCNTILCIVETITGEEQICKMIQKRKIKGKKEIKVENINANCRNVK